MNHKRYGIWRLLLRALVISLLLWTQVSCGSRSIPETAERPRNSDRQQAESIERTLQSEYQPIEDVIPDRCDVYDIPEQPVNVESFPSTNFHIDETPDFVVPAEKQADNQTSVEPITNTVQGESVPECPNEETIEPDYEEQVSPKPVEHEHNYTVSCVSPTCVDQGYTIHICECGNCYCDDYTPTLGHDWVEDYEERIVEVTELQCHTICGACGADLTAMGMSVDEILDHTEQHAIRGESSRRYEEWVEVVVGSTTEMVLIGAHCSRCGMTQQK